MNPQQLWQAILGELELILSKANFTTWFKNTGISSVANDEVVISVPNGFTKEWLEKKYHQNIVKAYKNITGASPKSITYKIEVITTATPIITPTSSTSPIVASPSEPKNQLKLDNFTLNPKYTFANFIVGKNNELAHAASLAVAKNPGTSYNPLFMYGGVGLGKTHLMQAIGHAILENNPSVKVLYVSCEKFTNDYIAAIQSGKASDFEKKYRLIDVLLIDDIQFISGKERTQEAFFYTFNELHQHNKQVVISSDRPPKAIAALEHRLVSRFEWGMIADISAPDLETKMAIIETKAREKNYVLTPDITQYLATVIHNNVRELEGALNRIIAHSQLLSKTLGLEEVKQVVSSITAASQKKSLTPKTIISIVAEYFDIAIEDIIGPCRKKNLTEPRQIIMYLIREELKSSYPTIGQEIGGRDHTTVIHAYEKINRNIKTDDKLRHDITALKQKLAIQ
ncbi:MAG: chromosomal replication initiator protein DnaA [Candidatus Buchananbacteria bacterium]|nr:chromosomal replication initiator protein DnaA [Candidatus Buchananbacteria bacterium]